MIHRPLLENTPNVHKMKPFNYRLTKIKLKVFFFLFLYVKFPNVVFPPNEMTWKFFSTFSDMYFKMKLFSAQAISRISSFDLLKIWSLNWKLPDLPSFKVQAPFIWKNATHWFKDKRHLKRLKKVSWILNGSYKITFWWVKCKWIRHIWIKLSLNFTRV